MCPLSTQQERSPLQADPWTALQALADKGDSIKIIRDNHFILQIPSEGVSGQTHACLLYLLGSPVEGVGGRAKKGKGVIHVLFRPILLLHV